VTGCGASTPRDSSKKFKGEERAVAATVEQVESAARSNKPDVVCGKLLTNGLLQTLKRQGTNCRTGVKEGFKDADTLDITVKDVAISGDKATAKIESGSGSKAKSDTLELVRDGTTWKIDQQLPR
jgi:hypothetical protein